MHTDETLDLKQELQNYGLESGNIRLFSDPVSPDLLDYLDLVEPRSQHTQQGLLPDGVAESQGRPLLFFVNESHLSLSSKENENSLGNLRRILACRGDRAYLAKVRPGELSVIPISLSDRVPTWKLYTAKSAEAITFFSRLAQGCFDGEGEPRESDFVFKEMLGLLNQGADRLAELLGPANVLSLLGRALFFRFLCDRNIITERDTGRIAPKANDLLACFDNAENAYSTSHWLDRTFNGDFLPLDDGGSREFFNMIGGRSNSVFFHLKAIIQRYKPVGAEAYQTRLDWSDFDFAHVPVGLLSQVYEAFCWKWEPRTAKETSIYYTPRRIAGTLVDEAFEGLPNAHEARVLDPACGAGVFLVLAFRRLYQERWKAIGRPDTRTIRSILEKQITGFDISGAALKLAALGLYLTAIELDPEPIPPEKLRFTKLNNSVLFNHRLPDEPLGYPVIGSLGAHVGKQFDGQFDIILSNPPWTSLSKEYPLLAAEYTAISKAIILRRGGADMADEYQNPDSAPDLPIFWKSTEWCKPSGHIAMALPARILLKQEDIPRLARETMFRLIEVTGIINGANLSDTAVWPKMSQPFLLFFARNNPAKDGNVIHFVTLQYDKLLNRKGEARIDSKSAQMVEVGATFDEPWLWKTLTVGTTLDVEVIRRLGHGGGKPLESYWEDELRLDSGAGYMVKADQTQYDASFLRDLPDLAEVPLQTFEVDASTLPKFQRSTASRPRHRDLYRAPLALMKQAPGPDRTQAWALLSSEDVTFNQSLHGYSGAKHSEGALLVRYLHLFAHCNIRLYFALMTRPRFGAERRVLDKGDLDECPIIPLDRLTTKQRQAVVSMSKRLVEKDERVFDEIDSFFCALYGLDNLDLEVIRDTLDVCLPYGKSHERACKAPSEGEMQVFGQRLEMVIRPFFKVLGKEPQVIILRPTDELLQQESPFGIIFVAVNGRTIVNPEALFRNVILDLAHDTGTTRIVQQTEDGLLIGILRQYRFWTPSRARLLGAEIIRQHMGVFQE